MAVLMAAYESSEKQAAFVDLTEYIEARAFESSEMPSPGALESVFQQK